MTRVKRSVAARARHKKVLKKAKGYRAGRSKLIKLARTAVMKAGTNAYRDRKLKKRTFRSLWITRISAALRGTGIGYSRFINRLAHAKVKVDRKILAQLALEQEKTFTEIVTLAKNTKPAA